MKKNDITQLEEPITRAVNLERAKLHARMKKHGFQIEWNRLMRYGCIIRFVYKGVVGWLMIYKNRRNRTTFCFSFIHSAFVINLLLNRVRPSEVALGQVKYVIPNQDKRDKIKWWRENIMRRD